MIIRNSIHEASIAKYELTINIIHNILTNNNIGHSQPEKEFLMHC